MRNRAILRLLAAALLLTHAGLLAYGAAVHSPCIDEVGHMIAGISHWRLGRFDLYHVNPPLVRMVAVIPVLCADPKTDWSDYSDEPGARSEFGLGRQFITDNGPRSFWFFTWARWACIPFSLLGGYVCYRWARELYGDWSGLLALTLWCFDPYMLANGQLITPDMGATALGVTAAYLFWKWLKRPGPMLALFTGLALGLAELTKMTWILLFALWPLLWLVWRAPEWRRLSPRNWLAQAGQLGLILLFAVYVINAGYGGEGSMKRLGDYRFVSTSLSGRSETGAVGNRFAGTRLAALPVPVPANYLQGIDVQKHDFEKHFNSYLCGEWRKGGWWYYYLFALAIKVPLGVWLLALLAAFLGLTRRGYAAGWRDELTVLAPGVLVLAFVSAQTGFNHHSRYVLPIFPYFFVWMSKAAKAVGRRERVAAWLTGGAVAWAAASSLLVYPHSLSYFNELVGGPAHGGDYLLDSNIDWGQDVFFLRDWLKAHPEARPLGMAYFGYFDPRIAGIDYTLAPKGETSPEEAIRPDAVELGPHPGWYAVSVSMRQGLEFSAPDGKGGYPWFALNSFSYFQRFKPVGHAGWSIYIYHITPEECARVREKMGLPPWTEVPETKP